MRSEIAYLNHGMLVRHIIDESSPLYRRTPEMLRKEDSIFTLSVVSVQEPPLALNFEIQFLLSGTFSKVLDEQQVTRLLVVVMFVV